MKSAVAEVLVKQRPLTIFGNEFGVHIWSLWRYISKYIDLNGVNEIKFKSKYIMHGTYSSMQRNQCFLIVMSRLQNTIMIYEVTVHNETDLRRAWQIKLMVVVMMMIMMM